MGKWKTSFVKGTDFISHSGILGKEDEKNGHRAGSFSGSSTVILGAHSIDSAKKIDTIAASWNIPSNPLDIMNFKKGFIVMACKRKFGGLHSLRYDSRANVFINDKPIDSFALRIVPDGHSDYFHKMVTPLNFPKISPISECENVYYWNLFKDRLEINSGQLIRVEISKYARWDIDFLGLVFQSVKIEPSVFISYSHQDKYIAQKIAKDLSNAGIRSWIDEGQLGIGDSILDKISNGINDVEFMIALLSNNSIRSKWVQKELMLAMTKEVNSKKILVLPIILEEIEIPFFLSDKYYGDLRSSKNYSPVLSQIISKIKGNV